MTVVNTVCLNPPAERILSCTAASLDWSKLKPLRALPSSALQSSGIQSCADEVGPCSLAIRNIP